MSSQRSSIHEEQPPADRQANVERCLEGTLWMARQVRDRGLNTSIIPLVKGCTATEWEICDVVFDRCEFEFPMATVFATQYFTGGVGIRIDELVTDVTAIARTQSRELMLIGLLSPRYLQRMPAAVRAATGLNQWRQPISPRAQTSEEMRAIWTELTDDVSAALDRAGEMAEQAAFDAFAPEQKVA